MQPRSIWKIGACAAALALGCGCSSGDGAAVPNADASADTRIGQPLDSGDDAVTPTFDTGLDAASDAAVDTGVVPGDSGSIVDSGADSASAADASADAESDGGACGDAGSLEECRCRAGAPRLAWNGAGDSPPSTCIDMSPPQPTADYWSIAACSFQTHADGRVRCIPIAGGEWRGWQDGACAAWSWVDCGIVSAAVSPGSPKALLVSQHDSTGWTVHQGKAALTYDASGNRYLWQGHTGACSESLATVPSCPMHSEMGLEVGLEVPASSFYASPF